MVHGTQPVFFGMFSVILGNEIQANINIRVTIYHTSGGFMQNEHSFPNVSDEDFVFQQLFRRIKTTDSVLGQHL